jgi:hypothetical protein
MTFKSRKLRIWLVSAAVVLAIYLFYNLISRTPPIEFDTGETVAESNAVEIDGKIGKVGDVGVGTIRKAKYTHLNTKKQIDREFGFEKLLHAEGNEWEIEKPYMNIYRHHLKCYMTADRGKVQIEDAVGRPTPTDATLSGNVVVRILPEEGDKIEESFVYLDDLIFISEKSQFSTAGPVRFSSPDAQMLGKGLEAVYNDELDRLEFLRINELESLRIRQSSKTSLFSPQQANTDSPVGRTHTDSREAKEISPVNRQAVEKSKRDYYKCVFRKNVVIDSSEQLILADEVSISDILWSDNSGRTGGEREARDDEKGLRDDGRRIKGEPNESSEQFADIVLTCDDGIAVVPMNSSPIPENETTGDRKLKSPDDKSGKPAFVAKKIDYSLITESIVAEEPSELTFYASDFAGAALDENDITEQGKAAALPVKITAQEKAEFRPRSNQVIFQGNVLCTMLREDTNFQQKYNLSAPELTVDLFRDERSRADIKHLTATGGLVQLDTSKWTDEKLLGFTKLKCLRFDYDAAQQMFLATGSGIIAVDNSKIAEPRKKTGRFSLQRPCYAVVRNFDTLKYFKKSDVIIADAANEQILIDYFPVVRGKHEQQTSATANYVEAALYQASSGQTELSTLSAKGGITYEEKKEKKGTTVQFVGSEMFYDGSKSMITARGDESRPCFLNGALAPGIEYDLKSDRIKTGIIGPGMLQMRR